jgi:hypothetical protein
MTKNALKDLTGCLRYSDDWEVMGDYNWDDIYDNDKVEDDASSSKFPSLLSSSFF